MNKLDSSNYDANTDVVKNFDILFNKLIEDFEKLLIDISVLEEVIKFLKVITEYNKYPKYCKSNPEQVRDKTIVDIEDIVLIQKFILNEDKTLKIYGIKILRYLIELFPYLTLVLKKKMFPLIICKTFEDRLFSFEERFEVTIHSLIPIYISTVF